MIVTITFDADLTPAQRAAQRARLVALALVARDGPPEDLRPFWQALLVAIDDDDHERRAASAELHRLMAPPVVERLVP